MDTNTIYCFWTGDNPMNEKRIRCLQHSIETSECNVILVTKHDLYKYVLKDHPLHPAYQYLSETHKADYLRTYFANFHGGGYMDIKRTLGSWNDCFEQLRSSDKWICGYKMHGDGHVAYAPNKPHWDELIGTSAYICKPQTMLTKQWYNDMSTVLESKIEKLKLNPARYTDDSTWRDSGYPIGWTEILGEIFHRVSYDYKDKMTRPSLNLDLNDYR
jgi:hypothetical protein